VNSVANVSIYLPEDAKAQEILKRVEIKRDAFEKEFGRKPSFSEMVMLGLEKLVQVEKK
jgi:hypothetical protein